MGTASHGPLSLPVPLPMTTTARHRAAVLVGKTLLVKEPSASSLISTTATSGDESSTASVSNSPSQPPTQKDSIAALGNTALQLLIQPWHVVLGDSNCRDHRTTTATKLLRKIKREHLNLYKGQRKDIWIPKAIQAFTQQLANDPCVQQQKAVPNDIGLVLVKCTPKAKDRIATPNTHAYPGDTHPAYGVAHQRAALTFFLESRDPPRVDDEVARHRRNFDALASKPTALQPPPAMMNNFGALLDFVQSQLDRAEQGDAYAAAILDSLSPINKLKIHWRTLIDSGKNQQQSLHNGKNVAGKPPCSSSLVDSSVATNESDTSSNISETDESNQKKDLHDALEESTPIGLPMQTRIFGTATGSQSPRTEPHDSDMDLLLTVLKQMDQPACDYNDDNEEEGDLLSARIRILDEELGHGSSDFWKNDYLATDDSQVESLSEPADPAVFDIDDEECPTADHYQTVDEDREEPTLPLIRVRQDDTNDNGGPNAKRLRIAGMTVFGILACATIVGVLVPISRSNNHTTSNVGSSDAHEGFASGDGVQGKDTNTPAPDAAKSIDSNLDWVTTGWLLVVVCLGLVIAFSWRAFEQWCDRPRRHEDAREPREDVDGFGVDMEYAAGMTIVLT